MPPLNPTGSLSLHCERLGAVSKNYFSESHQFTNRNASSCHADWPVITVTAQDFEDEYTWLRHRGPTLRTESGLRELIAEAEQRLEQLEVRRGTKASTTNSSR
jgi:hypothetical protein